MLKIIGNGLLARSFNFEQTDKDVLIFASGVSDSSSSDIFEFEREKKLLYDQILKNEKFKIVYFSSIFAPYNDSDYYKHKIDIERFIESNCEDFLIVRLPQIVGFGGNKKNIFNYFKENILRDKLIKIQTCSKRSLLDIEDVRDLVIFCISNNQRGIVNFNGVESISVLEIAKIISESLDKKLIFKSVGSNIRSIYNLDNNSQIVTEFISQRNIKKEGYTKKLIKKYC